MKQFFIFLVVLCAAFVAAQDSPEVVRVSEQIREADRAVTQAANTGDNAAYQAALERVSQLQGELADQRSKESRDIGRLNGQVGKVRDGLKKVNGRVDSLASTVRAQGNKLRQVAKDAEKGRESYDKLAGPDGVLGTGDDILPNLKAKADHGQEAYDVLAGKDGKIGTSDDPIIQIARGVAGAASKFWLWVVAFIAIAGAAKAWWPGKKAPATPTPRPTPIPAPAPAPKPTSPPPTPPAPSVPLSVTKIDPAKGPDAGGTDITIEGNGFVHGEMRISIDGKPVSNVKVARNGRSLTCETPASTTGPGTFAVRVEKTSTGEVFEDPTHSFTYVP